MNHVIKIIFFSLFVLNSLISDVRNDTQSQWIKKVDPVFPDYPYCYQVESPSASQSIPIMVYIMSNKETVLIDESIAVRIFVESLHDDKLDCKIKFQTIEYYSDKSLFEIVSQSENWDGVLNAGDKKYIDIIVKPRKYLDFGFVGNVLVSPDMSGNTFYGSTYKPGIIIDVNNSVPEMYYEVIKYLNDKIQFLEEYIYYIENGLPFVERLIQIPSGFNNYFNEDSTSIFQLPAELEQELESLFNQVKSLEKKYKQLKSELWKRLYD